ncbi:Zinc finger protein 62 -like protein [Caligus rogercresseyi]|uniref:Zinc finger protein 62 -like protein n=1 Tax=Caligus rogercresseyi TaxID=217165 RepID=A0A7T8GV90_CALRO|nr:Zinc finger protein 62 -like protein [Caligus rogercresseyi]
MHMNLHLGRNVHACKFCERTFAHKHVYESHLRTHTERSPFAVGSVDDPLVTGAIAQRIRKSADPLKHLLLFLRLLLLLLAMRATAKLKRKQNQDPSRHPS